MLKKLLVLFCILNLSLPAYASTQDVRLRASGRLVHGRKAVTTSGTELQLSSSSQPCNLIMISALDTNTGVIVVGTSSMPAPATATRQGMYLWAGQTEYFPAGNLNAVYVDATVSGEGVSFTCFTD